MRWILGTANFGNMYRDLMVGNAMANAILNKAWELGIRDIDTARTYGDSEQMIADYVHTTGRNFRVWTKGRSEADYEESKKILGFTPHVFLWHNWDITDKVTCHVDGVSTYDAEPYVDSVTHNDIIQVPWNIIDRINGYHVRQAQINHGVVAVARSVFIRGEAFNMFPIAGVPFWHWCLQIPDYFDYAVVGVDTPEQLEEIVNVPHMKLIYTEGGLKCRLM